MARGPLWALVVNRNQTLLGKTMLVLVRACEDVAAVEAAEWAALHVELTRARDALRTLFAPTGSTTRS